MVAIHKLDPPRDHLTAEEVDAALTDGTRWRFGVELLSATDREPVDIAGFRVERAGVRWAYRAVDPTRSVNVADATPRRTGELVMEHVTDFNPLSVFYRPWVEVQSPVAKVYREQVVGDGPAAYWRLGESSGTVANDETGNGHDGAYEGAPTLGIAGVLTGDSDTAARFNGGTTGDAVHVPQMHGQLTTWSVEVWVYKLDTAIGPIVEYNTSTASGTSGTSGPHIWSYPNPGDLFCNFTGVSGGHSITVAGVLQADTWHHIAAVYDGATARLYLDGQEIGNLVFADTLLTDRSVWLAIRPGDTTRRPAEILDEVAIYERALTATEITQHYDAASAEPTRWVPFRLGLFTVAKLPGLSHDGVVSTRQLQLSEVSGRWAERRLARPLTIEPGTNVVQWVKDDLQVRFKEPDVTGIDDSTVALGDNVDWDHDYIVFDRDTPLIDVYDRLLAYAGYEPLYVDVDGRPISHLARDPQEQGTSWTFGLPLGTGIVPEIDIEPITPELPNILVFEARNGPSLLEEGNGRRTVRNEDVGPGSINQRGRSVEDTVTVEADSQDELDRIARMRAQRLFAGGGWTLSTVARAVPLLGDSDVVSLAHTVGTSGVWVTTQYGFSMVAGDESAIVEMDYEAELVVGAAFASGFATPPAVGTKGVGYRMVAA